MKKTTIGVVLIVLVAVGVLVFDNRSSNKIEEEKVTPAYLNISYQIEGNTVALKDGKAETAAAPGSASKTTTQYFGNLATGDLNGDGLLDAAFLLEQQGGGSGTFYYVVVALKTVDGYRGTNAVLLGDRIAPQTTEIHDGTLVVNYADRKAGEPMSTRPSLGVSKYLTIINGVLTAAK